MMDPQTALKWADNLVEKKDYPTVLESDVNSADLRAGQSVGRSGGMSVEKSVLRKAHLSVEMKVVQKVVQMEYL